MAMALQQNKTAHALHVFSKGANELGLCSIDFRRQAGRCRTVATTGGTLAVRTGLLSLLARSAQASTALSFYGCPLRFYSVYPHIETYGRNEV
jgi:hypothetical protein